MKCKPAVQRRVVWGVVSRNDGRLYFIMAGRDSIFTTRAEAARWRRNNNMFNAAIVKYVLEEDARCNCR